jgi:transcriptional regulator with XRE-family HTH domain
MSSQALNVLCPPVLLPHPFLMTESEASRLRTARRARRLTQEVLAKCAGLDQTAISKAETGRLRLEGATLGRVADALGVSTTWLREGSGTGPAREPEEEPRGVPAAPGAAFEAALEDAFDKSAGHRLADVDAVRAAFAGQSITVEVAPRELAGAARRILDAAASARADRKPVTLAEILLRVAM